jgi:hypothetical protein
MPTNSWLVRNGKAYDILMTNNRLNGNSIKGEKLEALRVFTTAINETRGWPSSEQVQEVLRAGYTEQTILEVIH